MAREGLLIVLSAPSGTGKGTLLKLLKNSNDKISLSISATTRKPRENEVDGRNYFFKTEKEFKEMIINNELIEWVEYCGNLYGTPKRHVEELLAQGYNVILEIEVEGALEIRNRFPDSVLIFVLPPSFKELENRIRRRGTEDSYVIEKRLKKARKEIEYINKYDYVIINDKLEKAVFDINSILRAETLKYKSNTDILNRIGGCLQ